MPEISIWFAHDICEIYMRYAQKWLRYTWDMPSDVSEISSIYVWRLPRYVWETPDICLKCVSDMPEICQRFARDLPEIFLRYAWYIPDICLSYAWKNGMMREHCEHVQWRIFADCGRFVEFPTNFRMIAWYVK